MNLTVIGWYGTETIGDRAILTGILSFFSKSISENIQVNLGSLNPYFTERTVSEDEVFINRVCKNKIKIDIFDTQSRFQLKESIDRSDILVMGGGPLMDLRELSLVEYAFSYAKKKNVKTMIMGCGVGPLFFKKYRKKVLNIVEKSDSVILRDNKSKINLFEIYNEFKVSLPNKINVSFDPAVECVLEYKKHKVISSNSVLDKKDYIAVNIREFPSEYSRIVNPEIINTNLAKFVRDLARKYSDKTIYLIPMHYYFIGKDDRYFLSMIKEQLSDANNIIVQNENLNLEETISVYENAFLNFGMRFHSVVLQTICSGKNFILDYTEPGKGKINGFLSDVDEHDFYSKRYMSLQKDSIDIKNFDLLHDGEIFKYKVDDINLRNKVYIEEILSIL